ncbi:hypothetical protein WICMUC_003119 [Wickerhamomyces mucosus]|uniref:Pre-mRNA-splicing factor RSE1 n=1 Tax=Wickerhamomyces mucosus TaxID=1378264 RepID=A0A9P8TCS6_9ASCO|nr:hypothetical protein WICMUC_003119 [Wickerhamomyces mucosus]
MSTDTELCLYNLTLRHPTSSVKSCVGNFSGKKSQEIITATSSSLIVYKPDSTNGKLTQVFQTQIFAIIRSIANFKIAGSGKDYLAVTSDAGNLSILELDLPNEKFISLFNEPFAKSGIRRLSPGEELCIDSKGRALLATAIEKNKLLYVVNRDLENKLTLSSPLEANRSKILTINCIGLDVGYENPEFAAIEIDYSDYEFNEITEYERYLTYYELDLGLNNILKKHSELIPSTSNLLLPVPGGNDGPSGVLVCSKNLISYRNLQGDKLAIPIPKLRKNSKGEDSQIVSGITHKIKDEFFFLVQTNHNDLFKVELPPNRTLTISYFDTLPSTATSLIILKSGFLFADSEYGDKHFYQFEKLGSDTPYVSETDEPTSVLFFDRTEELDNLLLVDIIETMNPILNSELKENKLVALTGLNNQSFLKVVEKGLKINEIVESDIPGISNKVWTTKLNKTDEFDKYIIISFLNSTLVLKIAEDVEEALDSGLELNEETIGIQQIGESSLLQILHSKLKIFKNGELQNEWLPPAGIKILENSTNSNQITLSLSNNEIVYFEIDEYDRLVEFQNHLELSSEITSLSLGEIPEGRIRSQFLAVGCSDQTIRILSTSPENTLESLSLQVLTAIPSSIAITSTNNQLYCNIGLQNGVFIRSLIDSKSGEFLDTIVKYLGNLPVILSKIFLQAQSCLIALSNKTWLIHEVKGELKINPLMVDPLKFSTELLNEDIENGLVGIHNKTLKIFSIEDLSKDLNISSLELRNTAKNILHIENNLYIVESNSIEVLNHEMDFVDSINIDLDKKIVSTTFVNFQEKGNHLIISINEGNEYYLYTYDSKLKFIHKTQIPFICHALIEFESKLLVGYSNELRLYDIGIKQLLSKSISKISIISKIVKLEYFKNKRLAVADVTESIVFCKFSQSSNEFIPFADDILSRHITSFEFIDYHSIVGGDKFGNIFVLRLDEESSRISDSNLSSLETDPRYLNGAKHKFQNPVNFFIQDIPTSFHKGSFSFGGQEIILYTGLQGTLGCLIPILTKADIKFFKNLLNQMRTYCGDLLDRSNLKFRGYYQPPKNCIDGDLIELFNSLEWETKMKISNELNKSPREISKKIFEIKSNSI